jgi:hypothetical protein
MAMSNHTESGVLTHLFRTGTYAKPTTIAIALTTNIPDDTQQGFDINEVANAGAYARVNVGAPADADWDFMDQVNTSGHMSNTAAITFTAASANWGMVSGVAIIDNSTYGQGAVLFHGPLPSPRDIQNTDQYQFAAGELDIYLD